jgi:hypothetical protein
MPSPHIRSGEVYSMQYYVIKFVSGFLRVFRFPPPIKLTALHCPGPNDPGLDGSSLR